MEWKLTIQTMLLIIVKNSFDALEKICASSSGVLTGLYCLEFDQVFWLVAIAVVLPHLEVEPFQVRCILFSVEKGAADSLFPNTCSDHLQAAGEEEPVRYVS